MSNSVPNLKELEDLDNKILQLTDELEYLKSFRNMLILSLKHDIIQELEN